MRPQSANQEPLALGVVVPCKLTYEEGISGGMSCNTQKTSQMLCDTKSTETKFDKIKTFMHNCASHVHHYMENFFTTTVHDSHYAHMNV